MKKSFKRAIMTMMAAFVMLASTSVHTVANTGSAGNVTKLADGRTVSPGGELMNPVFLSYNSEREYRISITQRSGHNLLKYVYYSLTPPRVRPVTKYLCRNG